MTATPPLRILIFGINYAPELAGIAPYTTGLAENFARQGHQVEVITGLPHYPEWRRRAVSSDRISNPKVHRYPHSVPRRPTVARRALYEVSWLLSAGRAIGESPADVAIGVIPSLSGGILSWLAQRRLGIPFGLIFQDIMSTAAQQSGYVGGPTLVKPTRWLEGFLARRAGAIAIVAEGFRDHLAGLGVQNERIFRVRNWTRPATSAESTDQCRRRLGWSSADFICLHAGNMGVKQGLDTLLATAQLLRTERVRVVFAGNGNDRDRLEREARKRNLHNVSFIDPQAESPYESMLQSADVLILNQRASVEGMALPSKLTSYFASGRPVVAAVSAGSETAREIRAAGGGLVIPPEAPHQLAKAVLELRDDPSRARGFGERGLAYSAQHLSQRAAFPEFDKFLGFLAAV
ncbi:MAG TPA: glycosyltransferase family 4 protein [Isosphaeraceae bacterium]|nr:glycosyltransferase family 4 protein [Isosphaeraceae bacterium]